MPSVQSVHIPGVMNSISVVGRKRQERKCITMTEIHTYAAKHGISFISAYRTLASNLLSSKEK